jgi:hypothetical protein
MSETEQDFWSRDYDDIDDLAPSYGIIVGCFIGTVLWLVGLIALFVWLA